MIPHELIDREQIPWEFIDVIECTAVATYRELRTIEVFCDDICQRPDNPCIVDINYSVDGDGWYEIVPELTAYSLDTTDGMDGSWNLLQPITTDAQHSGQIFEIHGKRTLRFVADMCDHVSSFFSEPRVCFRITIREYIDLDSVFGGFDDQRNPWVPPEPEPEPVDPFVAPTTSCQDAVFGTRVPRE